MERLRETRDRRCPHCRSENVEALGHVTVGDGMIKQDHRCAGCSALFLLVRQSNVRRWSFAPDVAIARDPPSPWCAWCGERVRRLPPSGGAVFLYSSNADAFTRNTFASCARISSETPRVPFSICVT